MIQQIYKETYEGIIITFKKPITVKSMFHDFVEICRNRRRMNRKLWTYLRENWTSMNNKTKEHVTIEC